jgi:hypothetical protein
LHKIHQEKVEYLTRQIHENKQNIKKIEKEINTNFNEYNNLKDNNPDYKDEEKEKNIFDNLKLYEDNLKELQELVHKYKKLVTKEV